MNTHDIQAFVAVVETGSISGAATRLHLTQPGISRRIQSLESTLGVTLLDRLSKPLKPTVEGRDVYALGQRVLRSVDELVRSTDERKEFTGSLRLGVPSILSELVLSEPINNLLAAYPRLALKVSSAWSPVLLTQVQDNLVDAAVVIMQDDAHPGERLAGHQLAQQALLVVASEQLDLPDHAVDLHALSRYPWILNQDGCAMRGALRRKFTAADLPLEVAVEAFGAELQMSLVSRGLGLGIVTAGAFSRSAFRRQLKVISVPVLQASSILWLVHGLQPGRLIGPLDNLKKSLGNISTY